MIPDFTGEHFLFPDKKTYDWSAFYWQPDPGLAGILYNCTKHTDDIRTWIDTITHEWLHKTITDAECVPFEGFVQEFLVFYLLQAQYQICGIWFDESLLLRHYPVPQSEVICP